MEQSKEQFRYDIFLSYSSKDAEAAQLLWEELKTYGLNVFLSQQSLQNEVGISFFKKIEDALLGSQHFLLICTPNAMDSEWVRTEYETFFNEFYAHDMAKRKLILFRGHDFNIKLVPLLLRRLQIADSGTQVANVLKKEIKKSKPKGVSGHVKDFFKTNLGTPKVKNEKLAVPSTISTDYKLPFLTLLNPPSEDSSQVDRAELEQYKDQIINTLLSNNIEIIKIRATIGPTVILFEAIPAPEIKMSNILNVVDKIALSLKEFNVRMVVPIPGKDTIGIEVPAKVPVYFPIWDLIKADKFQTAEMFLPLALGKSIANEAFIADLSKMPHLLIGGNDKKEKTNLFNAIILSLLYSKTPQQFQFLIIATQSPELLHFDGLAQKYLASQPNAQRGVMRNMEKVPQLLKSLQKEMDLRYDLLKDARAKNIHNYNKIVAQQPSSTNRQFKHLPQLVVIIDEIAPLIVEYGKVVEHTLARIAQLSRAVGIHIIIATGSATDKVITRTIQANYPVRLAFNLSSKEESKVILTVVGAEQLIGDGDLILTFGKDTVRLQAPIVKENEIRAVINYIKDQPDTDSTYSLPAVF